MKPVSTTTKRQLAHIVQRREEHHSQYNFSGLALLKHEWGNRNPRESEGVTEIAGPINFEKQPTQLNVQIAALNRLGALSLSRRKPHIVVRTQDITVLHKQYVARSVSRTRHHSFLGASGIKGLQEPTQFTKESEKACRQEGKCGKGKQERSKIVSMQQSSKLRIITEATRHPAALRMIFPLQPSSVKSVSNLQGAKPTTKELGNSRNLGAWFVLQGRSQEKLSNSKLDLTATPLSSKKCRARSLRRSQSNFKPTQGVDPSQDRKFKGLPQFEEPMSNCIFTQSGIRRRPEVVPKPDLCLVDLEPYSPHNMLACSMVSTHTRPKRCGTRALDLFQGDNLREWAQRASKPKLNRGFPPREKERKKTASRNLPLTLGLCTGMPVYLSNKCSRVNEIPFVPQLSPQQNQNPVSGRSYGLFPERRDIRPLTNQRSRIERKPAGVLELALAESTPKSGGSQRRQAIKICLPQIPETPSLAADSVAGTRVLAAVPAKSSHKLRRKGTGDSNIEDTHLALVVSHQKAKKITGLVEAHISPQSQVVPSSSLFFGRFC